MSAEDIRDSVEVYRKSIEESQIVMFPGGFSAGDEPEGSAKFFATAFRNEVLKDEIMKLLNERDGLMLGICNGFRFHQAWSCAGRKDRRAEAGFPTTLTYNTIGRHVSKMVNLKVVSTSVCGLQAQSSVVFTQTRIPRRGTFLWLEGMDRQALRKRTGCDPVCGS